MTYKTKSLIYFSCFVIASIIYYEVEQQDQFQDNLNSKTYVEAEFQDAEDLEDPKKDLEEENK
ncbi:hypothetical protein D2V93_15040 [Flagellimonas taeanensis]|jgi:hypothetical protein|uniref:Secreted protein n=1 Tax=Flagellimonas taeanensis TaxID=1005926 RepID=A0A1M7CQK9_9FLAO|nr:MULTISPECIES: hypothetical protein [Allomuricauda]MDC6384901.1 hypothetical protein [Muricauda sp. SK9]MEE1961061.1 hypothetical protein [Allomuricauda taeanensis]RIV49117.1 hypothetical protein D2V93_15040 [Allomuricauda taeanensis]SFC65250.1 hypothetical protein SAMN04487891_11727 [Allomuricauda taeanensis]SHL69584.1 hypothetical protein SAMN05216293_4087 [Allomuricauda taeanensis]